MYIKYQPILVGLPSLCVIFVYVSRSVVANFGVSILAITLEIILNIVSYLLIESEVFTGKSQTLPC